MKTLELLKRYGRDIRNAIKREKYELSDGGVLVCGGIQVVGEFVEGVNGGDWRFHKNLVVDQGMRYFLNMLDSSTSKISAWYLAPFSGSTSPAAAWTAANFTSNSTEITATSGEGFTESTRQACTLATTSSNNYIDNYAAKAAWTVDTASTLSVTGLGLLSSSVRGGTSGTLISATKFATARSLQDADTWNTGYRITLTAS